MQVLNTGNLPLRIRFYASMVDTQMLAPNESYSKLKESYIIMICPFDPYGQGRHIYSFRNRCDQDHGLLMGDDTVKIVLNAVGTIDDVSEGLKAFLDYVAGKPSEDEYIQKLEEAVKRTKANKTWRKLYMTQRMRDLENQDIGRAQGADMAKRDTIRNMLNKGMKAEEIADLCGYDISFVKEVEQDVMEPA